MKRVCKSICSLLSAVVIALCLSIPSLAAESTVTFKGAKEGFVFQPGSGYTATDLFDNFKDVMPGDKLTEIIQIKNIATDCDYINLYLRTVIHDENGNPLTYSEAFENTDGKDQANVEGQRDETVATMQDFLSQLTMDIYNGEDLIYRGSPDQSGALADNVPLGTLHTGESLTLTVKLTVPAEMGNEYANRVGEVDWVFLAEAIQFEKLTVHKVWDDNADPDRPGEVTVHLLRDGERYEQVVLNSDNQWTYTWDGLDDRYQWSVEEEVPQGYEVSYRTEDNTVFITNHNGYEPPVEPQPVDLTVHKVWSDEEDRRGIRPDSVIVTLYDGDRAVAKVVLDQWNNWTYSWKDLDGAGDWNVIETGIPNGYVPSYRRNGDTVTITNTVELIQTGQLSWPVAVLGSLGVLMLFIGIKTIRKQRKSNA